MSETEVSDDQKGNLDTIAYMKRVARLRATDPLLRRLAENILAYYQVQSNFYVDEALAIGDYVKNKIRYIRDPDGVEYLQDPLDLAKKIEAYAKNPSVAPLPQGDCDDMALLAATLLLSAGHEPYFRAVRYQGYSGNYNHIYVVVYDKNLQGPKERVVLDCIMKNQPIGYEIKSASGDEFKV